MIRNIALVDDDQNIVTSVKLMLEMEGFNVVTYSDGAQALQALSESTPIDLMVLDIKMPRMDGLEVLKRLRKTSKLPVIFLTSKDDDMDELIGLRLGADDYIRKPFSQRLLIERIRVVLRRDNARREETVEDYEQIKRGLLTLCPTYYLCYWRGKEVSLTITEFEILLSLAKYPGHVKTRDQLLDVVYGGYTEVEDRTIDSHIKRLRNKFRRVDSHFAEIETLYGLGYRYRAG